MFVCPYIAKAMCTPDAARDLRYPLNFLDCVFFRFVSFAKIRFIFSS